jgi:hypothetical protein
MKPLTNAASRALHWTQTRLFDSTYDLVENDEHFARLTFRTTFGSFARLETAAVAWTFKRVGFWRTRATVRQEGADIDLASFEHNTWSGGGTLRLADGREIRVTTSFWKSRIEFQRDDGTPLFRYQTEGFMRLGAALEVFPAGAAMPELPWLLGFGWYLVVMTHHDQASQAVVIG